MAAITISPDIQTKVSRGERTSNGNQCNFYIVGGIHGLKMYHRKSLRDNNYLMQKFMHTLGLCPAVFNKVDIGNQYGFVTELCETGSDIFAGRDELDIRMSYGHLSKLATAYMNDNMPSQIYWSNDMHDGNYGLSYHTHNWQHIDVGCMSLKKSDGRTCMVDNMDGDELSEHLFEIFGYTDS